MSPENPFILGQKVRSQGHDSRGTKKKAVSAWVSDTPVSAGFF